MPQESHFGIEGLEIWSTPGELLALGRLKKLGSDGFVSSNSNEEVDALAIKK